MRSPRFTPVRPLWVITALAVAARVGAALYLGDEVTARPGTADQVSYHALALRVLDGHGFSFGTGWWPATPAGQPTAHWSFAYVSFLAGIYGVFGPHPLVARIVQAVLSGVLQPLLAYRIGGRLFGPGTGVVAAGLVAGYAYFVYYAGALMTESFFIVAVLWSLDLATRLGDGIGGHARNARWVALGVALATATLLRQAFLVCVPLILLWLAWRYAPWRIGPNGLLRLAGRLGLVLLVIAAGILPWTIRNYRVFDQAVLLNTNAGFAFFWGNHPVHGSRFQPILPGGGSVYGTLIPPELEALDEARLDRALLRRGVGFVTADPVRYLRLCAGRAREFVKFWPSPESDWLSNASRVASFGACLPFMLAGVFLVLKASLVGPSGEGPGTWADAWLVLGVALVYSTVHVLTWTLVRYRLPVDALLLPFAALSMSRLYEHHR